MPANTLILKGTIVQVNADNRGIPGADGQAYPAVGVASQTYDNRTGAISGGGNDDLDCEVEAGVFGFAAEPGHEPDVGDIVFVSANDEISTDSDAGARGIAGRCVEIRDSLYWIYMGPHVGPAIVEAATVAADLDTAEAAIDALEADALTAQAQVNIPITSCTNAGAPLVAFADGVADGIALVDSEVVGYRWNPSGSGVLAVTVPLPQDLDDAEDVVVHLAGFRIGAADTTTVLAVGAFFQTMGAAYTAAANCGGNTTAWDAATTVMAEKTVTIAAADVPAAPCLLTLTIEPSAALDADDFVLSGLWLEYTRKLLTA
jgi:hypothetical protein